MEYFVNILNAMQNKQINGKSFWQIFLKVYKFRGRVVTKGYEAGKVKGIGDVSLIVSCCNTCRV